MRHPRFRQLMVVVAICAVTGALAGIAGSAAAPSGSSTAAQKAAAKKKATAKQRAARREARAERRGMRGGPGFRRGGPPVHSEAVVPNKDGDGFITVTMDHGVLLSVDGTTLHVKQGTDDATYKEDAAIDVGSDAKVVRNGEDAKLSDLAKDDRVHIVRSPEGNVVMAASEDWRPRFGRHRHGHGRGGPGGPPPGMPGMPGDGGGSNENGSGSGELPSGSNS